MKNYHAPNPYPKKSTFFSSISSIFSSCSSESIGTMVIPALQRSPNTLSENTIKALSLKFNLTINTKPIETHDEASLETIQLTPVKESLKPIKQQRFIIKFNGNGMQYTDFLQDFSQEAEKLQETVIAFNYRGVGNSKKKPKAFQDLVTDGIAQVQRLLDLGADPKTITLDGLSLGGGVATMVAYHFHQQNKQVYLWNDRSFASLSKTVAGMLAPNLSGVTDNLVNNSLTCLSWSVLKPTGWDVDIASAYKTIPNEFKGYMVVAKQSDHSNGDGVISHNASLHKGVHASEKETHLETGHKVLAQYKLFGGHNLSRKQLISKNNHLETGQDLFEQFEMKKR